MYYILSVSLNNVTYMTVRWTLILLFRVVYSLKRSNISILALVGADSNENLFILSSIWQKNTYLHLFYTLIYKDTSFYRRDQDQLNNLWFIF